MSNTAAKWLTETNQFDDIFLLEMMLDQSKDDVYFLI